jgi:glutathione synthase/RimK-type ligase-like ATP-grasp enzyme
MREVILILSNPHDSTAQRIAAALQEQGARSFLFDTSLFPKELSLNVQFEHGGWQGTLSYEGTRYALADIKSILVRRPTHYRVDPSLPEPLQAFLENEALKGFGGVLRSLAHVLWVNALDANRAANFKPVQLQAAAQVGLHLPRSLITNSPAAVRDFYEQCHGRMVYKTLHGGGIAGGGKVAHTIFTSLVTPESLAHLERVKLTAHYFQHYIDKQFDLRVTVVGNEVFAVAISSQHSPVAKIDWRAAPREVRYAAYELPEEVARQCVLVTQRLGLCYSAIDLIVTPAGEYVFLECNPGGQYEWLEVATGLPISAAIATVLRAGKEAVNEEQ